MKIAVIGHLCLDVIEHPGMERERAVSIERGRPTPEEEARTYGGIFFSVTALANLAREGDTIHPVFGVGRADYAALVERLKLYQNVDTSGIFAFTGPTNNVRLMYADVDKRVECSKNISDPIPYKKIKSVLDADMILVNMISGFDVTLETLDEIRMEVREAHTPIYLDVHSITLGIRDDFTRFHRAIDTWRRWLFMIHAAQMNEDEARILSKEKFDEPTLAKHALALNTNAMIVTRGPQGYTAYVDEHKIVKRYDNAAIDTEHAVDATGCGDVFAAAYCAHYVHSHKILDAAAFANRAASLKAAMTGSARIDELSALRLQNTEQLARL
jgi:sugar/nucleoside kinase (ribokinase family)